MAISMEQSNASKSPFIGLNAVFGYKMVVSNKIDLDVICKKVPAMQASGRAYNLPFLTQNYSSKGNEQKAADWIKLCLRRNSSFSILPASSKTPCLKNLGAFHTTDDIRPDVTVLHTHDVPVPCFTVEVVSSTYKDTLKKTNKCDRAIAIDLCAHMMPQLRAVLAMCFQMLRLLLSQRWKESLKSLHCKTLGCFNQLISLSELHTCM